MAKARLSLHWVNLLRELTGKVAVEILAWFMKCTGFWKLPGGQGACLVLVSFLPHRAPCVGLGVAGDWFVTRTEL